jgi:putative transposase
VALLRYGLIADLVHLPEGHAGLYQRRHEKAARAYPIPGSTRTRVAAETLRDWPASPRRGERYRQGGFDALLPNGRADRGRPRGLPPEGVDRLLALKAAHPTLSVRWVIPAARARGPAPAELPLPLATVHRLLARHGLLAKPTEQPSERDRRRFARRP